MWCVIYLIFSSFEISKQWPNIFCLIEKYRWFKFCTYRCCVCCDWNMVYCDSITWIFECLFIFCCSCYENELNREILYEMKNWKIERNTHARTLYRRIYTKLIKLISILHQFPYKHKRAQRRRKRAKESSLFCFTPDIRWA